MNKHLMIYGFVLLLFFTSCSVSPSERYIIFPVETTDREQVFATMIEKDAFFYDYVLTDFFNEVIVLVHRYLF